MKNTSPSSEITKENHTIDKNKPVTKNPATKVARLILLLALTLIFWYVLTDRYAPYSSQGAILGYITQLSAQVNGQVTDVFVVDGDIVEADTPLFQLDKRVFELAVSQAKTNLARAIKTTEASAASIVSLQAALTVARIDLDNTRRSTDRTLALAKRSLLSKAEEDNAKAQLKSAQASYQRAEAELNSAMLSLGKSDHANLEVQAAQISLDQAMLNLEYSTVKAPTLGVVTNLQLAIGQYVAPGTPAMTFIDGRGAWIAIDLRENQIGNIDAGDTVSLFFDAVPGKLYRGTVKSIAWGIDPGRKAAGGLIQNQSSTQWFEPARHIPIYIELDGGTENWPKVAKAGGKVSALVYAEGEDNPIALISSAIMHIRSYLSYLY
ncbi:HlyD family secretion protein [Vibrio rumoiensis]|uniref:HlyD family secretion protein n=1 Tax=Vibrio rumoiensis TaxID=76258 RepID=A0ABW7J0C7_9VIBR